MDSQSEGWTSPFSNIFYILLLFGGAFLFLICIVLCIGVWAFFLGDSRKVLVPLPPYNASTASLRAMELFDTNKDGKISGSELDKVPGLKASLRLIGTNEDKGISANQILRRVQNWIDSKVGRIPLCCTVKHNGQPLVGASVRFVPEKFLSDVLKEPAVGTTNETGRAIISLPTTPGPDAMPPGVAPGFYRVEITKDGENIPAKYNVATELGQDLSLDNFELQKGITFDLNY